MIFERKAFFILDNKNMIREWSISGSDDYTIHIYHGVLNGKLQHVETHIPEGLAGRSRKDQLLLKIASLISKRRDMGYSEKMTDAYRKPTNTLGFKKPMLAKALKTVKNIDFESAFIQRKYDGNRMLINSVDNIKTAYTRNGKILTTVNHILDEIDMPDGTLDGELYCHGESLQTIVSWAKRIDPTEDSLKLKFH